MSEFTYPKILHLIWDDSKLSFLNYLTIVSFHQHHPDWNIHLYYTTTKVADASWNTPEQKAVLLDTVEQYWDKALSLSYVKPICVDEFAKTLEITHLHTIQQSDILRVYILYMYGGVYSDFDIIYTKNIESFFAKTENPLLYMIEPSGYKYYPVGLLITQPKNNAYRTILQVQLTLSKQKNADYQLFGTNLFRHLAGTSHPVMKEFSLLPGNCYLPIAWFEAEKKLYQSDVISLLDESSFGVHWFNGLAATKHYINQYTKGKESSCTVDRLVDQYRHLLFDEKPPKTISIVMAYFNRKRQLLHTLKTISSSTRVGEIAEVIIVDDGSHETERLEQTIYQYNFPIVLTRIDKNDKKWVNPCIPYNIALSQATGDIVLIQNPEVCHVGDVLDYCIKNACDDRYLTFSVAASASLAENEKIYDRTEPIDPTQVDTTINISSWYNHPTNRNSQFHFLSCMTKTTLKKVGGFNEQFRYGLSYDDDEFLYRVKKVNTVLTVPPDTVMGIHLWHTGGSTFYDQEVDLLKTLITINLSVYTESKKSDLIHMETTNKEGFRTIVNRRVILFGSTGMLGTYVNQYLNSQNIEVVCINRDTIDSEKATLTDIGDVLSPLLSHNGVVINCIGLIPQKGITSPRSYIAINTVFPQNVSKVIAHYNDRTNGKCRFISITTDCVFSGKEGNYTESHLHDSEDIYGITKSMGETTDTIIRTSIIGEERTGKKSLLEWVKGNKGGEIPGYNSHFWNGITCLELSKVLYNMIKKNQFWTGIRHIFSETISKFDLVKLIDSVYNLEIDIKPVSEGKIDKSLSTNFPPIVVPSLYEQVAELKNWNLEKNEFNRLNYR